MQLFTGDVMVGWMVACTSVGLTAADVEQMAACEEVARTFRLASS